MQAGRQVHRQAGRQHRSERKEAKKNDCARIDLEVRSYNEARKFYEKLGFTQDHSNLIYELNKADFKKISLGQT